ncbi:MAG: hypothetical protein QM757_26060 [Paludibaculum sp.]
MGQCLKCNAQREAVEPRCRQCGFPFSHYDAGQVVKPGEYLLESPEVLGSNEILWWAKSLKTQDQSGVELRELALPAEENAKARKVFLAWGSACRLASAAIPELLESFTFKQHFVCVWRPLLLTTLQDLRQAGPVPLPRLESLFRSALRCLDILHRATSGFCHGAMQPATVFIAQGGGGEEVRFGPPSLSAFAESQTGSAVPWRDFAPLARIFDTVAADTLKCGDAPESECERWKQGPVQAALEWCRGEGGRAPATAGAVLALIKQAEQAYQAEAGCAWGEALECYTVMSRVADLPSLRDGLRRCREALQLPQDQAPIEAPPVRDAFVPEPPAASPQPAAPAAEPLIPQAEIPLPLLPEPEPVSPATPEAEPIAAVQAPDVPVPEASGPVESDEPMPAPVPEPETVEPSPPPASEPDWPKLPALPAASVPASSQPQAAEPLPFAAPPAGRASTVPPREVPIRPPHDPVVAAPPAVVPAAAQLARPIAPPKTRLAQPVGKPAAASPPKPPAHQPEQPSAASQMVAPALPQVERERPQAQAEPGATRSVSAETAPDNPPGTRRAFARKWALSATLLAAVTVVGYFIVFGSNSRLDRFTELVSKNQMVSADPNKVAAYVVYREAVEKDGPGSGTVKSMEDLAIPKLDERIKSALGLHYAGGNSRELNWPELNLIAKWREEIGPRNDATIQAQSQFCRGMERLEAGQMEEAIGAFDAASAALPNWPLPKNGKARARFRQGRPNDAEALYIETAALDPKWTEPLVNLGNLYTESFNEPEKAEAKYREALAIQPNLAVAQYLLGVLYQGRGPEFYPKSCEALKQATSASSPRALDAHMLQYANELMRSVCP